MINFAFVFHPSSCGYYCLKKILKKVHVENKKYMSLYEVGEILRKYNYDYKAYRVSKLVNIGKECITLVKVNKFSYHYVIIKEVSSKYVYYYDPLFINLKKKKIEIFNRKWLNVCMFYNKL